MNVQVLNGKDLTIKDLKRKIRDLETENKELCGQFDEITRERDHAKYCLEEIVRERDHTKHCLEEIARERDHAQYCLEETRKSFSYKLGYMLTAIPRKLRNNGNSSSK